jgi:CsoR family transcriptional regulator, copper-sensing transcriptional repressor
MAPMLEAGLASTAGAAELAANDTPGWYILAAVEDGVSGYAGDRDAVLKRLARVEGQVRGVKRMVEEDAYCIDVLTQLTAISKALEGVGMKLLADHTDHCVRDAIAKGGSEADEKVDELLAAVERFAKR